MDTESQLREAVLSALSLSYSTGPSGTYLEQLFKRWGVFDQIKDRIVVPPAGTPVGLWVSQGKAALGFQQRSELMNQEGVSLVGDLPTEVACITTFSAGIGSGLSEDRNQAVHTLLHYLRDVAQENASAVMAWTGLKQAEIYLSALRVDHISQHTKPHSALAD